MEKLKIFLELINEAIVIAEKYEGDGITSEWVKADCHLFIKNMKNIIEQIHSGADIRSGGAGLGIIRFLSENEMPLDLYAAGSAIEVFFKEQMK